MVLIGKTPLTLATTRGHLNIVRELLEFSADPNILDRDGRSPLHIAVQMNSVALTAELLSFGADPSKIDASGRTGDQLAPNGPCAVLIKDARLGADLVDAARLGDISVSAQLSEYGPHVTNFRDEDRWTAMHGACFSDSPQIVRILAKNGARLESATIHGYTPLIEACATGHVAAGRALLDCGANVDAADVDGWTSLHYGAAESRTDVVKMLLNGGAAVNLCTNDGKVASDLALGPQVRALIEAREQEEAEARRKIKMNARIQERGSKEGRASDRQEIVDSDDEEEDDDGEGVEDGGSDRRLRISKLASRVSLAEGLLSQSLRENEVLRDAVVHMAEGGPGACDTVMAAAADEPGAVVSGEKGMVAAASQELRRLIAVSCAAMSCLEESGHHIRQVEDSSLDEAFIQFSSIELSDTVVWTSKYSQVVEGRLMGRSVVVKRVKVDMERASSMHRTIFDDVAVFPAMRHPNLVTCLGVAFSPRPEIVFSRVAGPSLHQFLHGPPVASHPRSAVEEVWLRSKFRVIRGMCDALLFLHLQSCQHGRFSSRHVLLGPDMEARVCGFSMAKTMGAVRIEEGPEEWIRWSSPERAASVLGEVMDCSRSDVYSFAMVCWELCTEIEPYGELRSLEDVADKIRSGDRPFGNVEESQVPALFTPMLVASLSLEPSMRPSFLSCQNFLKTILPQLPSKLHRLDEHCRRSFVRELDLLRLALDRGERMEPNAGLHAMELQARWQWAVQQRAEHVVQRALEFGIPVSVQVVGGVDYGKLARNGVSPSEMFELDDLVREPSFCPLDFVDGAMEVDWNDRILVEVSSDFGNEVGDEIVRVYQQLYSRGAGVSRKVLPVAIDPTTGHELSPTEILTSLSRLMRTSTATRTDSQHDTLPVASIEVASSKERKKSVTESIREARRERDELVEQLRCQAKKFMAQGEFFKAVEFLNKGLELDPDNVSMRVHQSAAYFMCEHYQESFLACELALTSSVDQPALWIRKATCLLKLGDLNAAEAEFRAIINVGIDVDPATMTNIQRVRTIIKLGSFLMGMSRFAELLKHVTEGRSHSSDNDDLLLLQGCALIGVKESSLAIRTAESVLLRTHFSRGAWLVMGFTAFQCFGNLAFAVECFELAAEEEESTGVSFPVPSHDTTFKDRDELSLSATAESVLSDEAPDMSSICSPLLVQAFRIAWDIRRAHTLIREAMEALEHPQQEALPRIFRAQELLTPSSKWGSFTTVITGEPVKNQLMLQEGPTPD